MRHSLNLSIALLLFGGCAANTTGVTPSQNKNLNVVSPSITSESEDGPMQRALDRWLKEEWTPLTQDQKVTTTKTMPDGKIIVEEKIVEVPKTDSNETFKLQNFVDKWKVYQENKEKMNAGKPKDPSHIDMLNRMPLIGK